MVLPKRWGEGTRFVFSGLEGEARYTGQMIGTLLCRYSENFIKSTMKNGQKICIDLRSFKGKEGFYQSLGYNIMSAETGAGMEKMLEK